MSADKRHPPNPYLRREREMRNWTLADTARALRNLMASYGETQPGVTMFSVSRWELGFRRPAKLYRRYLCLLFAKRPDELGFLPRECAELAQTWPDEFSYEAVSTATETPDEVIRRSRVATCAAQPSQSASNHNAASHVSKDELEALNVTRRQLLYASGLLGAAVGTETAAEALGRVAEPIERAVRVASGRAAADDKLIASLDVITDNFDRAYRTSPGRMLAEPLGAHIDLIKAVLEQPMLPAQRDRLLCTAAHATAIMACRQFSDHGDRKAGRRWLRESIRFGEATDDADIHVLGVIRASEQYLYTGQPHLSVQLMHKARALAERRCSPNTLSWVLVSQAEAYAAVGNPQPCPRLLDLAREAQQRSQSGYEPVWLESWDSNNDVAGYAGAVYVRLGQPGPARAALHQAMAKLDVSMVKARSIYLVDLATTYTKDFEVEQACELASQALELAGSMHYRHTMERMQTLRRRLTRWQSKRAVQALDERLRAAGVATA